MKKRFFAVLLSFALFLTGQCTLFAEELPSEGPKPMPETITGFDPLPEDERTLTFSAQDKPSLSDLLSQMPETLPVYYNGSGEAQLLPVTWESVGEDYETSDSFYFQFSPKWEETTVLAENLDRYTDAPYISVFLTLVNEAENTESSSLSLSSQALGASITSSQVSANELQIYRYLIGEMGFNCAAACGILANIRAESSFNPTATGDNGTSYGICQWHNTRWTDLKNYCAKNNLDWTTLDGQLRFLNYELEKSYPTILRGMKSRGNTAEDAYLCGAYWCETFERPANAKEVGQTRGNLAMNTYFPKYSAGTYDGEYSSPKNPKDDDVTPTEPETGKVYEESLVVNQKLELSSFFDTRTYTAYEVSPAGYASVSSKGILTAKKATGDTTVKVTGKVKKDGKWVYSASSLELSIVKPCFSLSRLDLITEESDNAVSYLVSAISPDLWSSSNQNIAVIDQNGQISAHGKGTAKITAVFGKNAQYAAKYSFTLRVGVPALNKKNTTMLSGASTALTLKVFSKTLSPTFISSDENIASVDKNGLVTALSAGVATITAVYNGQTYPCSVTVKKPTISAKTMTLKSGAKRKIALQSTKLTPKWQSENQNIAYVDGSGYVIAKSEGQTVISSTTGGCTESCLVTVKPAAKPAK